MRVRLRFTEGQELELLRVTDDADIITNRTISKVNMDSLEFKGLRGAYDVRGAEGNILVQGNKILELLSE